MPTTFIPMAAVDKASGTICAPQERSYGELKKRYTFFCENDVLFAKITPRMQNGKHVIARNLIDGIGYGSTEFHVLRPSELVLPEWIHLFLRQKELLEAATAHFTGSVGQQRLPDQYLANLEIPLPSREIQKENVEKIARCHEAIARCQTATVTRDTVLRSLPPKILNEAFAGISNKCKKKLGDVCSIVSGQTPPTDIPSYWGGEFVWVTPTDLGAVDGMKISCSGRRLTKAGLEASRTKMLPINTVILSTRASIGYLAISGVPLCLGVGCKGFLHDSNIDSKFLYWSMMNAIPQIRGMGNMTTFPEVSKSALCGLEFNFPEIEDQLKISRAINNRMNQIRSIQTACTNEAMLVAKLPSRITRQIFYGE